MGVDQSLTGVPQFDNLEIIKVMKQALNKPANTEQVGVYVEHGLGYVPIIEGHLFNPTTDGTSYSMPLPAIFMQYGLAGAPGADNGKVELVARVTADINTIFFEIVTPNHSGSSQHYYATNLDYNFLVLLKRFKTS